MNARRHGLSMDRRSFLQAPPVWGCKPITEVRRLYAWLLPHGPVIHLADPRRARVGAGSQERRCGPHVASVPSPRRRRRHTAVPRKAQSRLTAASANGYNDLTGPGVSALGAN